MHRIFHHNIWCVFDKTCWSHFGTQRTEAIVRGSNGNSHSSQETSTVLTESGLGKNKLFLSDKATILAGLWAPPCGPVRRREGGSCGKTAAQYYCPQIRLHKKCNRTVTRTPGRWQWMLPRPVVPALRSPSRPRKRRPSRATRNPGLKLSCKKWHF